MKNKNQTICFSLIVFSVLILLFNSCKKDKTNPFITWINPVAIRSGNLLSAIQLNASSDVEGSFVYTPAIGNRLKVGSNQILKVEFIPTDYEKYNEVIKIVRINVLNDGITFNAKSAYGSLTDIDGNVYKTIVIGAQTWMAQNLRTTKYRNGVAIENVKDNSSWVRLHTGAYCNYNNTNNTDEIDHIGRLYNWYAAIDSGGIAPQGWHVPSDSEWRELQNYLGLSIPNHTLKEASSSHWTTTNTDDNTSGFTAFPCGIRYADNGKFAYLINEIYWLSSTRFNKTSSFISWNYNGIGLIQAGATASGAGWPLRCVKDQK